MNENGDPNQQQPKADPVTPPADVAKNPEPTQAATQQQLRETEQKIEEQIEERMTAFERSMIRLTRYGLAVTILTGIIFAGQLYEMISGGTQTDKLVDYANSQAQAATSQADAAQQFSDTAEDINSRMSDAVDQLTAAANNAKASIRATQDAMRVDQRAWVTIMKADLPSIQEPAASFGGSVRILNAGKTPAKGVAEQFIIEKVWNGDEPTLDYSVAHAGMAKRLIFPTFTDDFQVFWLTNVKGLNLIPVTPADVKDFKEGNIFFVLFGRVDYKDIFGITHWVTFCTWTGNELTRRNFTARKCSDYNDTDNKR